MKKMNNLITEREIFLKNSAEKSRSARQQSHLDLADLEGLPMPAVADMRARVSKRDSKYKRRKASLARTWKNETKARAQWARHMEGPCYTRAESADEDLLLRLKKDGFPVAL